ncbi:hypothetical protein KAX14_04660, partial [Candidatus Bipolaricaulota bacterium]|nr:hypothetical protein [Candidatus Bipolaricaulota bacterium]
GEKTVESREDSREPGVGHTHRLYHLTEFLRQPVAGSSIHFSNSLLEFFDLFLSKPGRMRACYPPLAPRELIDFHWYFTLIKERYS